MNSRDFTSELVRLHLGLVARHLPRFPSTKGQILWGCLMIAGSLAVTQSTFFALGVLCLIYGTFHAIKRVRTVWLGDQVDRIMRDFQGESFSGSVLGARLERLYRFGLPVPSVVLALLSTLP